jgi:hypothetical protein
MAICGGFFGLAPSRAGASFREFMQAFENSAEFACGKPRSVLALPA